MVFKRRDRPPVPRPRPRGVVYPRRGWRRAIEYLGHRVRRLPDTPHRSRSAWPAASSLASRPFFGLHFVCAACLAWAAARQHPRRADRHLRRQPADLPDHRVAVDGAGPQDPRLRRHRPRRRPHQRRLRAGRRGPLGRPAQPLRPRRRRVGQARRVLRATCSGPTWSAACCPASSAAVASYYLTRPLDRGLPDGAQRASGRARPRARAAGAADAAADDPAERRYTGGVTTAARPR